MTEMNEKQKKPQKKQLPMLKKKQKTLLKQLKKKPNNTIPLAEKRILITQSPFLFMPLLINNVLSDLINMKYV